MNHIMMYMDQLTGESAWAAPERIEQMVPALIAAAVAGLLLCFFGLKLVRVLAAVSGLLAGIAAGFGVAYAAGLSGTAFVAVILGCGILLAVLCAVIYRIGVFLWTLFACSGLGFMLVRPDTPTLMIVCLAVGIVCAVIAVIFVKTLVIIFTAVQGGISAGSAVSILAGLSDHPAVAVGIMAVLAILGMIVQFMMRSKEVKKKEQIRADEYKASTSREMEVEKARRILDEEDWEEETDSGSDSDEKEEQ